MNQYEISARARVDQGKGASRRLRRTGQVPAILYGAGKNPVSIQVDHNTLSHQLASEAFYSHILTLSVDGNSERVVLKDVQRHPIKPLIMHVDFQRIREDEEITMRVPVHTINEDKCIGVKTGGGLVINQMNEVEVLCLPKDLPEYIEVDVADLDIGDSIHLGDLMLPQGVRSALLAHGADASLTVVSVQMPKVTIEEEEEAAAEAAEAAEAEALEGAVPAEEGAEPAQDGGEADSQD